MGKGQGMKYEIETEFNSGEKSLASLCVNSVTVKGVILIPEHLIEHQSFSLVLDLSQSTATKSYKVKPNDKFTAELSKQKDKHEVSIAKPST